MSEKGWVRKEKGKGKEMEVVKEAMAVKDSKYLNYLFLLKLFIFLLTPLLRFSLTVCLFVWKAREWVFVSSARLYRKKRLKHFRLPRRSETWLSHTLLTTVYLCSFLLLTFPSCMDTGNCRLCVCVLPISLIVLADDGLLTASSLGARCSILPNK